MASAARLGAAGSRSEQPAALGQSLNFPVLADHDMLVTKLYGMVHPECDPEITVRTVFIIDPDKKVRLMMMYPPSAGRNFYEILRAVDSLQTSDKYNVATPVDWRPGEPAIIPQGITDEAAKKLFPQGWKELTPYLRIVELPRE